jgi:hypothetical protein
MSQLSQHAVITTVTTPILTIFKLQQNLALTLSAWWLSVFLSFFLYARNVLLTESKTSMRRSKKQAGLTFQGNISIHIQALRVSQESKQGANSMFL